MAIQISGTTVVNDSRQLQNIASLDSTTTATIASAAGAETDTLKAFKEIFFLSSSSLVSGNDVYYKGNNLSVTSNLEPSPVTFGTHQATRFAAKTFGTPSSISANQSSGYGSAASNNAKHYDGGQFNRAYFEDDNNDASTRGDYAQYYQNTTTLTVTYDYGTSRVCSGYAYRKFYGQNNMLLEAYVNNSWTQIDSFDGTVQRVWRSFNPVTASQFRFTATGPQTQFVFYENQFAGPQNAAGHSGTTPNEGVASAGSSVTAYAVVKGTSSGWTFQASRNNGSSYISPSTSTTTQNGDYYMFKLTYNLSSQTSASKLGMKVSFPNNADAAFFGCKLEG